MNRDKDNELPRTRAEAKRLGRLQYFTGKPCVNGHVDKRTTSSGGCLSCVSARAARRRAESPELVRERRRIYREKNIDSIRKYERERSRKRYEDNPDKLKAYNKKWRESHTGQERIRGREKYYRTMRENPEQIRKAWRREDDKRRLTAKGRLENSIKAGVHRGIVKGGKMGRSTFKLLGYSLDQLVRHLQKRFEPGMSWENYGEWHVDHKIPLSAHNYETPDDADFKRAWALTNLQPMWAPENLSKGAKLDKPFQPTLALH